MFERFRRWRRARALPAALFDIPPEPETFPEDAAIYFRHDDAVRDLTLVWHRHEQASLRAALGDQTQQALMEDEYLIREEASPWFDDYHSLYQTSTKTLIARRDPTRCEVFQAAAHPTAPGLALATAEACQSGMLFGALLWWDYEANEVRKLIHEERYFYTCRFFDEATLEVEVLPEWPEYEDGPSKETYRLPFEPDRTLSLKGFPRTFTALAEWPDS